MTRAREHLEKALQPLDLDDLFDRITNPRHTDHDTHAYLPKKLADEVARARKEVERALDELRTREQ